MPRLSIDIEAKLAEFQDGLKRVERDASRAAGRIESAFRGVGTVLATLGAGLTAGAFVGFVRQSINAADELNKLSQKVGVSVEALSALQYAAKLSDVSVEQLQQGLTRLNVTLSEAQAGAKEQEQAFASLRLDPSQFRSTEEAFEAIAERLAALPDGFEKTALAVKLFGRSGAELLPLLNSGADGLREFREEAERLGIIIDTQTARAAEAFNDNITRLTRNLESVGRTLANQVLPFLSRFTEELVQGQKAFGSLIAFINAQSIADAFRGPQAAIAAYRKELDALQQQLKGGQIVPEGLEFSDAAQERERGAIRARIAELQKLIKTYEAVIAAQVKSQVVEPTARGRAARTPAPSATTDQAAAAKKAVEERKRIERELDEYVRDLREKQAVESIDRGARALDEKFDDEARRARDAAEEQKRIAEELDEYIADLRRRSTEEQFDELAKRAEEEFRAQEQAARRTQDVARQLGLTFQSAFEDAVIGGEKLSDVLNALVKDIARLFIRKAITEPIFGALSGALGGIFAGFFADGGFLPPGKLGIVGERGPELVSGGRSGMNVSPMGGGLTIVQNIAIDSRSDQATILQAMRAAKEQAKAEILDSRRRGGVFA